MKFRLIITAAVIACATSAQAALVAGWDFQTTDTGGTSVIGPPPPPNVIVANFGAGTLYMDGSYGSSDVSNSGEVHSYNAVSGTSVNGDGDPAFPDTFVAAIGFLSLDNPTNFVFAFGNTGMSNLAISYAIRYDYGYNSSFVSAPVTHGWDYSTDGTSWTPVAIYSEIPTSFQPYSVPGVTGLDDVSTAFLRLNIGASGTGTVSIDNIRFDSTAIPEPGAPLILSGLLAACAFYRRRG